MFEALMDPGSMTQAQWLVVGILFILFIGILFFLYRIYLIIREAGKNKYKPNIGLHRTEDGAQNGAREESGNSEH